MRKLKPHHILLFRLLRDHFLFLTRSQIQRILTLDTRTTHRHLNWLVSDQYLVRRYRVDTYAHFQTPVYYLGKNGWSISGQLMDDYKKYERSVVERKERSIRHLLAVYDACLKFLLNSEVRRLISDRDKLWQEPVGLGNIPDCWIQYAGGEVFVEVDLGTEPRSVVEKKLVNYVTFKNSGSYEHVFPGCQFKVLFLTTTEERIEALEAVTPSDDIWYATMEEFLREPLDHQHWFALNGFYALPITR